MDAISEPPYSKMDETEFEFRLKPVDDESLGRYILAFDGEACVWDEQAARERVVGTISGYRVDLVSAIYDGLSQAEVLESLTPEIADFGQAVLKDSRCMLPPSEEQTLDQEPCDCLVYIARLWVEPGYRGQGMGSALLRRLGATIDIERCLIALKAYPIREDLTGRARADEIARVKHFYQRLGFETASGEFMVKDARRCEAIKKRLAGRRRSN
jgi:GNAT superfamily N-acetyltransferase